MTEPEPGNKHELLWHEGANLTEEVVTFAINSKGQVRVVNIKREDSDSDVNSIPGGFVESGEVWGSGHTARREAGEETKQEIGHNKLQSLGSWKCDDPRNSEKRWIETHAFLIVEFKDDLELEAGDDADAVNFPLLDSSCMEGKFYADHKKTVLEATKKLQEITGMTIDEDGFLKMEIPEGPFSFEAIVDKYAGNWENTGPKTLRRIWESSGGDADKVGLEIAKRELAADELARSEKPLEEFLDNFEKYSNLLDFLADGTQGPFGRFIRSELSPLGLYVRATPDTLTTQDYSSLFDKAVIRVSKNLSGIELNSKEETRAFRTAVLCLDIAKAGNVEDRKSWEGINTYVHNAASAELLRRNNVLKELTGNELLAEFFIKMVEYHGYTGQISRGEVTESVLTGLTEWLKENAEKLGIDNLPTFASEIYYQVNVIDTKSVRDGLFTEKLDSEFKHLRDKMEQVLKGEADWSSEKIENVDKKRELLADRLTRLRGGKDYEEVLGTFLELDDEKVKQIFDILEHAQLWYVESATAGLSPENQLKLLVLASKIAKEKGVDKFGNFDVNFAELVNMLKTKKVEDKALTKILDTALYNLSWENVFSSEPKSDSSIISIAGFRIQLSGEGGINGIKCELKPEFKEAVDLINIYYLGDGVRTKEEYKKYQSALNILEDAVGMKLDAWDRGIVDQKSYEEAMNATVDRKTAPLIPEVKRLMKEKDSVTVVEIASGTGRAGWILANNMRRSDKVIVTDVSRVMYEGLKKLSRVNKAQRYIDPEAQIAEIIAFNLDARNLTPENLGTSNIDMITASSVDHEIDSYIDKTSGHGQALRSIYKSALGLLNEPGQVFCDRDFIQDDNPQQKVNFRIGTENDGDKPPLQFFRDFVKTFELFTKSEMEEIASLPEVVSVGQTLLLSKSLISEILSHYSWMKDGGSLKEMDERHTRDDREGRRKFVMDIATEMGIKIEVSFDMEDPEYAKFNIGEFEVLDAAGNPTRYPFWMGTMKVKIMG